MKSSHLNPANAPENKLLFGNKITYSSMDSTDSASATTRDERGAAETIAVGLARSTAVIGFLSGLK